MCRCALAASVAEKQTPETALAALPADLRARLAGADGQPDVAFLKFYEALQETEPSF